MIDALSTLRSPSLAHQTRGGTSTTLVLVTNTWVGATKRGNVERGTKKGSFLCCVDSQLDAVVETETPGCGHAVARGSKLRRVRAEDPTPNRLKGYAIGWCTPPPPLKIVIPFCDR